MIALQAGRDHIFCLSDSGNVTRWGGAFAKIVVSRVFLIFCVSAASIGRPLSACAGQTLKRMICIIKNDRIPELYFQECCHNDELLNKYDN